MMGNTTQRGMGLTTQQRARWAYVYIRQSTPGQVARHGESTDLQYQPVAVA